MKKLLLIIPLIISNFANATPIDVKNDQEIVSPFPNAKQGINIVPLAEMNVPIEMKHQILAYKKIHSTKGYVKTNETDQNVVSLFKVRENAIKEMPEFDNSENPYDTHLKSSPSKIHLAFYFKGIPEIAKENVIGYAAAGGYTQGKGWDGIVEFIEDTKLGVCAYTTYKIEKAILDQETTEYLVNSKPTNQSVSGNKNVGFLYTVNWYTDSRLMSLECANKQYKSENINKMISLAKDVDEI